MSHTFSGKTCTIHYDGDYSGNISIIEKSEGEYNQVNIDIKDIMDFVSQKLSSSIISHVEDHEGDINEILRLHFAILGGV